MAAAAPRLWTGKPKQGLLLSPRDALLIPFSLMWCGFAVFWTYSVTSRSGPSFFTLWGLMFVGIGLYLVFGRFLHDAMIRARTEYSVSAAGVVVRRGGVERHVAIGQWSCLEMEKYADGSGTIRFTPEPGFFAYHNGNAMGFWVPSLERSLQFQRIAEAERVYQLLVELAGKRG